MTDPNIGHNSGADELVAYLERIERLEDEREVLGKDISDIWAEAKSRGVDVAALRKVHSLRKLKPEVRSMVGLYADKMGVFDVMD